MSLSGGLSMGTVRILSLVLAQAAALAPLLPAQDIAVRAPKVLTLAGPPIENGLVLVRDGRIEAVGPASKVKVPMTVKEIVLKKGVVMPALVLAATSQGMDRPNENMPVTPFAECADGIDPVNPFFEDCRRVGYGTVHVLPGNNCVLGGVGLVVRPFGPSIRSMTVADPRFQMISLSKSGMGRIRAVYTLERALADMARELALKAKEAKEKRDEALAKGEKPPEKKDSLLPAEKRDLAALVKGKGKAFFYCAATDDLAFAIRLSRRYGFKLVPILSNSCRNAAPLLKAAGLAAVLDPRMEFDETDPDTGEKRHRCPAAELFHAGVPFAITTVYGSDLSVRFPLWQAAVAVRNGVSPEAALAALTTVPARMLGLEKRLGALEKGKDGNLLLLSGDPLDALSWTEKLILEGRVVYDRAADPLLGKIFPPGEKKKAGKGGEK